MKIDDFGNYDEARVSREVKLLALCFNLAADKIGGRNGDIYVTKNVESLYKAVAGVSPRGTVLQTQDDETHLRLAFLKIGAMAAQGDGGWNDFGKDAVDKANELFDQAVAHKLIVRNP